MRQRHHDRERGAAAVEVVLVTPALLCLLLLVVGGGRLVDARAQVDAAARDAARAATFTRSAGAARTESLAAAKSRLAGGGVTCRSLDVVTDTAAFQPGGAVTTTVTCTVDLGDLTLLRLPGTKAISATAAEPIDVFRSTR